MSRSVEKLKQVLQSHYIENRSMGSPNVSTAIRDLLTDLMYIGEESGVNIHFRLNDAETVYDEEQELLHNKP